MELKTEYELYEKKVDYKKRQFRLQKIAIVGFVAFGITFSAIKHIHDVEHTKFSYNKNIEMSLDKSFSEQLEEYSDVELSSNMQQILNPLSIYINNKEIYDDISSIKGIDRAKIVEARKNYIASVKILCRVAEAMIEEKASQKIGNNAKATIKSNYNSADGPLYEINIYNGDVTYLVDRLPGDWSKLLNLIDEEALYKGDGTNEKWDAAISEYEDLAERIYGRLVNVVTKDVDLKYKEVENKKVSYR